MPNRNSTSTNGTAAAPYAKNESPNTPIASASMTTSPTVLVAMLVATSPVTYSEIAQRRREHVEEVARPDVLEETPS